MSARRSLTMSSAGDSTPESQYQFESNGSSSDWQSFSSSASLCSSPPGSYSSSSSFELDSLCSNLGSPGAGWDLGPVVQPLDLSSCVEDIEAQSRMLLLPYKTINNRNFNVMFTINLTNFPDEVAHSSHLRVDAVAETPSGQTLTCYVDQRGFKDPSISPLYKYKGSFKATGEIGIYNVSARVCLPMTSTPFSSTGVIQDTTTFIVSKNYFSEAKEAGSFTIGQDTHIEENQSADNGFRSSQANGSAHQAVSKIWGLACDRRTNKLFYSDRNTHKVYCIDLDTESELFSIDHGLHEADKFNRPTGLAVDETNGRLIVSDKDNHRISFFSLDGRYLYSFGGQGHHNGQFSYPWDVAVNYDGSSIVVADSRNKRVQLFDRFGNFVSKYSVFETRPFEYKDNFDYPRGVAFDNSGSSVLVTDFNTHNVIRIPREMNRHDILTQSQSEKHSRYRLCRPQGITVDEVGGILVCDSKNNYVRYLASDGEVRTNIRRIGGGDVKYPVNIALLSEGRVVVLDGQRKIYIF